jgi:hypothetical protein
MGLVLTNLIIRVSIMESLQKTVLMGMDKLCIKIKVLMRGLGKMERLKAKGNIVIMMELIIKESSLMIREMVGE